MKFYCKNGYFIIQITDDKYKNIIKMEKERIISFKRKYAGTVLDKYLINTERSMITLFKDTNRLYIH